MVFRIYHYKGLDSPSFTKFKFGFGAYKDNLVFCLFVLFYGRKFRNAFFSLGQKAKVKRQKARVLYFQYLHYISTFQNKAVNINFVNTFFFINALNFDLFPFPFAFWPYFFLPIQVGICREYDHPFSRIFFLSWYSSVEIRPEAKRFCKMWSGESALLRCPGMATGIAKIQKIRIIHAIHQTMFIPQ